jgi:hypothetical protein
MLFCPALAAESALFEHFSSRRLERFQVGQNSAPGLVGTGKALWTKTDCEGKTATSLCRTFPFGKATAWEGMHFQLVLMAVELRITQRLLRHSE